MNWERLANEADIVYGGFVDRIEGFFECPECGEPIYEGDDYAVLDDGQVLCMNCRMIHGL